VSKGLTRKQAILLSVIITVIVITGMLYYLINCSDLFTTTVPITRTCYPSSIYGLLIDEKEARRTLEKMGLNLSDIILDMGDNVRVYYLHPLYYLPVYMDLAEKLGLNASMLGVNTSTTDVYFLYRDALIIVIGPEDMVLQNVTCGKNINATVVYDPYTGSYIKEFTLLPEDLVVSCIADAETIIYIDGGATYLGIYGDKQISLEKEKQQLIDNYTRMVNSEKEDIEKCLNDPNCYSVCKPAEVVYINEWPVYFAEGHRCCKEQGLNKLCTVWYTYAETLYKKYYIKITSFKDPNLVLEQLTVLLGKL